MIDFEAFVRLARTRQRPVDVGVFRSVMQCAKVAPADRSALRRFNRYFAAVEADLYDNEGRDIPRFAVEHDWARALSADNDAIFRLSDLPGTFKSAFFAFRLTGGEVPLDVVVLAEREGFQAWGSIFDGVYILLGLWGEALSFEPEDELASFLHHDPVLIGVVGSRLARLGAISVAAMIAVDAGLAIEGAGREDATPPSRSGGKKSTAIPAYSRIVINAAADAAGRDYRHGAPGRRSPRQHVRRGHWHHYVTRQGRVRRWVNWQLVGEPDFGFLDHEYRL